MLVLRLGDKYVMDMPDLSSAMSVRLNPHDVRARTFLAGASCRSMRSAASRSS